MPIWVSDVFLFLSAEHGSLNLPDLLCVSGLRSGSFYFCGCGDVHSEHTHRENVFFFGFACGCFSPQMPPLLDS